MKVAELEDSVREKNQQILELECKMKRALQENRLLEDRNRKINGSPLSLSQSPTQVVQKHCDSETYKEVTTAGI